MLLLLPQVLAWSPEAAASSDMTTVTFKTLCDAFCKHRLWSSGLEGSAANLLSAPMGKLKTGTKSGQGQCRVIVERPWAVGCVSSLC